MQKINNSVSLITELTQGAKASKTEGAESGFKSFLETNHTVASTEKKLADKKEIAKKHPQDKTDEAAAATVVAQSYKKDTTPANNQTQSNKPQTEEAIDRINNAVIVKELPDTPVTREISGANFTMPTINDGEDTAQSKAKQITGVEITGELTDEDAIIVSAKAVGTTHTAEADAPADKFTELLQNAAKELNQMGEAQKKNITAQQTAQTEVKTAEKDLPAAEIKQSEIPTQAKETTANAPTRIKNPESAKPEETAAFAYTVQAKVDQAEDVKPQQVIVPNAPEYKNLQADQIRLQILENAENQRTEFEMQLYPKELGKIAVRFVLEDGNLIINIAAANPKTEEVLRGQVNALISSLKADNQQYENVQVVTTTKENQEHMYGGSQSDKNQANEDQQEKNDTTHTAGEEQSFFEFMESQKNVYKEN